MRSLLALLDPPAPPDCVLALLEMHRLGVLTEDKDAWHRLCRLVLKAVVKQLKIEKPYEIRSNKGGVAVLGETTLHTPTLYVQFRQDWDALPGILYRSCNPLQDYFGGTNCWMKYADLESFETACRKFAGEATRSL